MANLAVIPARIGSKRIPRKNIRDFCGKPIIEYSIRAARGAGLFSRVVVSTDSEEVAGVALKAGAEAPFMRPPELSGDHAPLWAAVEHALKWFEDKESFAYVCCILATAPFIREDDLRRGYDIISREKAGSVFSVSAFSHPILRALRVNESGRLEMFWPEHEFVRSNDLPEAYHDAGQFYWLDAPRFMADKRIFAKDARPVVLPSYRVQDIDTEEGWRTAELLFKVQAREGG